MENKSEILKEIEIENIDDAIESLTDDEQTLIKQRYFHKRKYKEIARELNITEDILKGYRRTNVINKLISKLIREELLL